MQEAIVDCTTGAVAYVPLSTDAQHSAAARTLAAAQEAAAFAAERAWRQQQVTALASVSSALHGAQTSADARALAGLVAKLVADPVQPLSAPEVATLLRFVLRCLLP